MILSASGWLCCIPLPARASEMEGYTEPYRTIRVATDETGIVEKVYISEGQVVEKGAPLISLNNEIQNALLAVAEQNMNAKGRLESAKAELQLKEERLKILQSLRLEGNARQEELDRAKYEGNVAKANIQNGERGTRCPAPRIRENQKLKIKATHYSRTDFRNC